MTLPSAPGPIEPRRPIDARSFGIDGSSDIAKFAMQVNPWTFEPALFVGSILGNHDDFSPEVVRDCSDAITAAPKTPFAFNATKRP